MAQLFQNNAYSATAGSITNIATTITLTTGTGSRFPSPGSDYYLATLVGLDGNGNENAWEIVKVTARSGDVLTVVRAQEGTSGVAWASGTRIEMRVTAGTINSFLPLAGGTMTGDLAFSGTGRRITGDLSNGTVSNRTLFQTSTANSQSLLGVIPSGTAVNAQLQAYNSSDPNNASVAALVASSSQVRIVSGFTGTGTLNPITFIFSNSEAARFAPTTLNFLLGSTTDDGVNKLQVTGSAAISGTVTAAGFSGPHNGTVGAITPASGAFTALSATSAITAGADGSSVSVYIPAGGAIRTNSATNPLYVDTKATDGGDVVIRPRTGEVGRFSPSGLSVTGTGSFTGTANAANYYLNGGAGTVGYNTSNGTQYFSNSIVGLIGGTAITTTSSSGLAITGLVSTTTADNTINAKFISASGLTRHRYVDATAGNTFESTDAGMTAYIPLSLTGNSVRINTGSGTNAAIFDATGNFGLGGAPNANWNTYKVFQSGGGSAAAYSTTDFRLTCGAYYNAGWKYIGTNKSAQILLDAINGQVILYSDTTGGTAGGATVNGVNAAGTAVLTAKRGASVALENATSVTGTGISFPATQSSSGDPNTLDDYEEGTWTPTIAYSGGNGTGSWNYTTQDGRYIKVGKKVWARFVIRMSSFSKGSAAGTLRVYGFPFIFEVEGIVGSLALYNATFTSQPTMAGVTSDSCADLLRLNSNSGWSSLEDPDADAQYMGCITYQTS